MSDSDEAPARLRPVLCTENSWCRAVPGGTGITVLALLTRNQPDFSLLENSLHKLHTSHPMLKSKLQFDPSTNTFSLLIPPSPHLHLQHFDLQSTAHIAEQDAQLTPFQNILEHELNRNSWQDDSSNADVFHASVYALDGGKWTLVMRIHTGACDRTAAVAVLRQLLRLMSGGEWTAKGRAKRQQDARIGPPETKTRREFDAKEREGRCGDRNGHTWTAVIATVGVVSGGLVRPGQQQQQQRQRTISWAAKGSNSSGPKTLAELRPK